MTTRSSTVANAGVEIAPQMRGSRRFLTEIVKGLCRDYVQLDYMILACLIALCVRSRPGGGMPIGLSCHFRRCSKLAGQVAPESHDFTPEAIAHSCDGRTQ